MPYDHGDDHLILILQVSLMRLASLAEEKKFELKNWTVWKFLTQETILI